jgi:hypothetical protein
LKTGRLEAAREACLRRWSLSLLPTERSQEYGQYGHARTGGDGGWDWSWVGLDSDRATTVQVYSAAADAQVTSAHFSTSSEDEHGGDEHGGDEPLGPRYGFPGADPLGLSLLPSTTYAFTGFCIPANPTIILQLHVLYAASQRIHPDLCVPLSVRRLLECPRNEVSVVGLPMTAVSLAPPRTAQAQKVSCEDGMMVSVTAVIKAKHRRHQSILLELVDREDAIDGIFPDVIELYMLHAHMHHRGNEAKRGSEQSCFGEVLARNELGLVPGLRVSFYHVQWKLSQRLCLWSSPSTTVVVHQSSVDAVEACKAPERGHAPTSGSSCLRSEQRHQCRTVPTAGGRAAGLEAARAWLGRLALDNAHRVLQMRFDVQARPTLLKKVAVQPM